MIYVEYPTYGKMGGTPWILGPAKLFQNRMPPHRNTPKPPRIKGNTL